MAKLIFSVIRKPITANPSTNSSISSFEAHTGSFYSLVSFWHRSTLKMIPSAYSLSDVPYNYIPSLLSIQIA
jgi:hypothetical protein